MLNRMVTPALLALRLYSRLPLPARARRTAPDDGEHAAGALAWLPAVGIAVSVPAAIAYGLAGLWLPHALAALVAIVAALLVTGAVHERGLARWIDPTPPGTSRVDAGAAPAIALATLLLARLEALSSIDPVWIVVTLVCAAAFSRGCAVLVPLPGRGAPAAGPSRAGRLWALACAVAPSVAAAQWTRTPGVFVIAAVFALLASAATRRFARGRERARDDGIGAVQTIAEAAFLLGIAAALALAEDTGNADLS